MKYKKGIFSFIVVISIVAIFLATFILISGCAPKVVSTSTEEGTTPALVKKPVIGFVFTGLTHPYHVEHMNASKEAAIAYGYDTIFLSSEGNMEKNLIAIESLIEQKVSLIVCDPVDPKGIIQAIDKCQKANIPFVTTYGIVEHEWTYNAPTPDYRSMYNLTQVMLSYLNWEGNFAKLAGLAGHFPAEERLRGFNAAITEAQKENPNIEELSVQYTDWDPVKAQKILEDWLVAYSKIDGIITSSDGLLYTAVDMVKNAGREEEINLFGHDGDLKALELVQSGQFKADVLLGATRLAWFEMRYAHDIVSGLNPPKVVEMPTNLVMSDETATKCYDNGLNKDIVYVTPEKAMEYAKFGSLEFGPDNPITYEAFEK